MIWCRPTFDLVMDDVMEARRPIDPWDKIIVYIDRAHENVVHINIL